MLHPPNREMRNPAIGPDGRVKFAQSSFNATEFKSSLFDRQVTDLPACRRPFLRQDVRKLGGAVPAVPYRDGSNAEAFYIRHISGGGDSVSTSPRLVDEGSAIAVLAVPGGRAVR